MIAVEFSGLREMQASLRKFAQDFPKKVEQALYLEAQIEATECRRRTPVQFGNLRASINVKKPERRGRVLVVYIYAGGVAAPYAVYVHEDLEAFHKIGEAKFIEGPLREAAPFLCARLQARLRF